MIEIWNPVSGYIGLYEISNFGNVKSLFRVATNGKTHHEKLLKIRFNNSGYKTVELNINGKGRNFFVHRLVANAFIENEHTKPEVNHIGDKVNNNSINLEWVTRLENERHCWAIGHKKSGIGHPTSREVIQLTLDGKFINRFENSRFIQKELGYNDSVIRRCASGENKTAYGFKWEYAA